MYVSPVALASNRSGRFLDRFLRKWDIFLRRLSGVDVEQQPVDRRGWVVPLPPQDPTRFHFAVFSDEVERKVVHLGSFLPLIRRGEMDAVAGVSASGSGVKGKGVEAIADYELPWSVASPTLSILR